MADGFTLWVHVPEGEDHALIEAKIFGMHGGFRIMYAGQPITWQQTVYPVDVCVPCVVKLPPGNHEVSLEWMPGTTWFQARLRQVNGAAWTTRVA